MKNIFKFIVLLIVANLFNACDNEFLEPEYKNGIVDQNFLTQPSHAYQALIGVYDVLTHKGINWNRMILGSSTADLVVEEHGDANWADLINLDKYRWVAENNHIWKHWSSNYIGIQRANLLIDRVPSIEGLDESLANNYIAEAKALRAFFYYNLVTAHGDVPLITKPISFNESKNLTRNSEAEVWAQIISDLSEARDVLPDIQGDTELGRLTKGAVNALLSKVYLWQKDYAAAEVAALAVIESPKEYELELNYADLYNGVSMYSKEAIFYAMTAAGADRQSIWVDQYDETNYVILWGPFESWSWFFQPEPDFVRNVNNDIEPGDFRVDTMTLDGENEGYDINADGAIDSLDVIPTSPPGNIHLMKYIPIGVDLKDGSVWSGGLGYVNQYIIRYAEVLLNYAEALVERDPSAALPYINMVRERVNLPLITTTDKSELLDIILNERKMEFCYEGMRFFDLKRVSRLEEFLGPLGWTSKNTLFPIPQSEIDLTKMSQNSGY